MRPTSRKTRYRFVAAAGLAGLAWAWALAAPFSDRAWLPDLATNLVPWAVVPAGAAAILARGRARRVILGAALALAALLAWWTASSRAAWDRAAGPRTGSVRVLQCNADTGRAGDDEALVRLLADEADVAAITEAPRALLDRLRTDPRLLAAFPFRDIPPWGLSNTRVLLSRWPLEALIDRPGLAPGDPRRALRLARVHHPDGAFVVLTVHPRSPRTPGHWREGNLQVGVAIDAVRELTAAEPLIVLADLNSTPTGARSRRLCRELGVARCKPAWMPTGTYPASLPWPLSAAIDDAWVSPGWRVGSWRAISGVGSDHRAVAVMLRRSG